VNFMPRPLYPRGKSHRYPLDRRLGGPQSRSGRRGEEKILDYRDSNSDPSVVQRVTSRYTDCAIPAVITYCRKSKVLLRVTSSGIMFVPSFVQIGHLVQELLRGNGAAR
jgi:hypothetical protein